MRVQFGAPFSVDKLLQWANIAYIMSGVIAVALRRGGLEKGTVTFSGAREREDVELAYVTPGLASRFLRDLPVSAATKNQALAGLRHFFDAMLTRDTVVLNPFHSIRGGQL